MTKAIALLLDQQTDLYDGYERYLQLEVSKGHQCSYSKLYYWLFGWTDRRNHVLMVMVTI